jgi:iron complex transport system ATP-binding protein
MNFAILERNRSKAKETAITGGILSAAGTRVSNKPNSGGILIDNVHFITPDGKTLVAGITFRVEAGERLAVVGPNGAGKTSLLKLLFGRIIPSIGSVTIDGVPIHLMPPMERARTTAVVSQSGQPDMRLRVRDYVELGRIPHRGRVTAAANKTAVERAMHMVGLAKFADVRLGLLSGGERQRAAIARAVAQEPSVLLLDEPTNHLDPRARADVMDLSCSLGCTVIAILHDLDRIASFADRVAVMAGGRLIAHGPAAEALKPETVRKVFDMDCFQVVNPTTGRQMIVFDTPAS